MPDPSGRPYWWERQYPDIWNRMLGQASMPATNGFYSPDNPAAGTPFGRLPVTNLGAGMGDYSRGGAVAQRPQPYAEPVMPRQAAMAQGTGQNTPAQGPQTDRWWQDTGIQKALGNTPAAPNSNAPSEAYLGANDKYYGKQIGFAKPGGGGGGQGGGGSGAGGQAPITNVRLQYAQSRLDPALGQGWAENFTKQNGKDPITFYMHSLHFDPNTATDPKELAYWTERAVEAAQNDAKFQPGAIADWQQIHGNTPIPQEQWERWYRQAQATGGQPSYGQGAGINPWGNY